MVLNMADLAFLALFDVDFPTFPVHRTQYMDPEDGVYEYSGKKGEQDGVEYENVPLEVAASSGEYHSLERIEEIHYAGERNQHRVQCDE